MTQKQIKRKLAASLTALVLAVSLIPARAAGAGYPDVPADEWYAQAVQDCQTYGLMDGTPEGTFQPSQLLTRAVVAEALYRLAGRPDSQGPQPFTDVPPNHINADAIRWAYQTCVVNGYPDGTFHPEDPIRREEIAVLLWSFRGRAPAQDAGYQDQADISAWAAPAVNWAKETGIMQGDGGLFRPQDHTTRAQAAVLLINYAKTFYDLSSIGRPSVPDDPVLPPVLSQPVPANPYSSELFVLDQNGYLSYMGGPSFRGVDVSSHQKDIDWSRVAMSGMDFAMIRAGYRGYTVGSLNKDAYFEQNIQGALANGLRVGVYFYSQAVTPAEAEEEARFLLSLIGGYPITYPVVFDWEVPAAEDARTRYVDGATATACARAFCQVVQAAGYIPMIYGSPRKIYNGGLLLDQLQDYPAFWLAHYTPGSTPTTFRYRYDMWQYSSTGYVDGIPGNVDLNICLTDWSALQ